MKLEILAAAVMLYVGSIVGALMGETAGTLLQVDVRCAEVLEASSSWKPRASAMRPTQAPQEVVRRRATTGRVHRGLR